MTSTTPITSNKNPWTKAAHVIVDWSDAAADREGEIDVRLSDLVHWVRTTPERAAVHVVLRRALHQGARNRRVQSTLQSLGCRVTMKSIHDERALAMV